MVLQNQWDSILHYIMGISAAMEVWNQDASPSSSQGGDNCSGDIGEEGTENRPGADQRDPPPRNGHGAEEEMGRERENATE